MDLLKEFFEFFSHASESQTASLLAIIVGLMVSHFLTRRAYLERVKDKDKEIERLVKSRNELQSALLKQLGHQRKTTQPGDQS